MREIAHSCENETNMRTLTSLVLLACAVVALHCSANNADQSGLPTEIRGITLEMPKEQALERLNEIAHSRQKVKKNQEVWKLKDDPNFSHIMVGFDKSDHVKYVTTTVEKKSLGFKERVRFSEIGDLSDAKRETVAHVNKYMWDVDARPGFPEHQVYTYGDDEEYLIHLSIAKRIRKKD